MRITAVSVEQLGTDSVVVSLGRRQTPSRNERVGKSRGILAGGRPFARGGVDSLAAVMYISAFNYQNPSRDVGMHTTAARGALLLLSRDVIDEFKTAWNIRNIIVFIAMAARTDENNICL